MKSQNKYYTPDITEFHVGFEFEISMTSIGGLDIVDFSKDPIQVDHISKPNNKVWEKTKVFFDTSYGFKNKLVRSIEQLKEILDDGNIRVKYLDKEDIESLGWEGQKANSVYFKKGKYRLVHWLTNNEIGRDISIYESYDGRTQEEALIRKAIIKNKSELKRLLKQLSI